MNPGAKDESKLSDLSGRPGNFSASAFTCTSASRAQELGLFLGVQAGEANLRAVVPHGDFTRFQRAPPRRRSTWFMKPLYERSIYVTPIY